MLLYRRSFGNRIAGHRRDMGKFIFYFFKCFFSHLVSLFL